MDLIMEFVTGLIWVLAVYLVEFVFDLLWANITSLF